ncbi:MAG: alpha-glucan family phosphorylase, partial [Bacteroidales bacterium]|nr:alpha-glucan family phosphorylase [Bacteroidales bacterium]
NQYYLPQAERTASLVSDDFALARKIAAWKRTVERQWGNISVVSYTQPDASYNLSPDNFLHSEVKLNIGELNPEDIGVEMLFCSTDKRGDLHIQDKVEFEIAEFKDGVATYRAAILPERTGMYQVATRYYAKNPILPHRQDFGLVRWL